MLSTGLARARFMARAGPGRWEAWAAGGRAVRSRPAARENAVPSHAGRSVVHSWGRPQAADLILICTTDSGALAARASPRQGGPALWPGPIRDSGRRASLWAPLAALLGRPWRPLAVLGASDALLGLGEPPGASQAPPAPLRAPLAASWPSLGLPEARRGPCGLPGASWAPDRPSGLVPGTEAGDRCPVLPPAGEGRGLCPRSRKPAARDRRSPAARLRRRGACLPAPVLAGGRFLRAMLAGCSCTSGRLARQSASAIAACTAACVRLVRAQRRRIGLSRCLRIPLLLKSLNALPRSEDAETCVPRCARLHPPR